MPNPLLEHLSRGRFSFLRPTPEELRRAIPDLDKVLPTPREILLDDEAATPLIGFPVLRSKALMALEEALEDYLDIEEESHTAFFLRQGFDSRAYAARWNRYRTLLAQALENSTASSHGQSFPAVFWLYHSMRIAQRIKEIPKRVLRRDLEVGRDHGDAIKYKLLFKLVDRLVTTTYDVAQSLSEKVDEEEELLFPAVLGLMRDNVLLLSEDHISPDLSELSSYFRSHLGIGGRELRQRLDAFDTWQRALIERSPLVRAGIEHVLGAQLDTAGLAKQHVTISGYVTFLSKHPEWNAEVLLTPNQVEVWESLLSKLKEFEIVHALRRMVVPLEDRDGSLMSRDRSTNATWVGGPPVLHLSSATRPYDFMAPWVVDPVVHRYGLVYDISEFSATLTQLGRAEASALDRAFRMMFHFQRRVNGLARDHDLKLEKYLGDGAFFSSRRARQVVLVALQLQRIYQEAIEDGFPFDRGLRMAMNYGQYRLLPLESGDGNKVARYEFFGHGLVELSRLATGKATQAVDDFKTYLVAQGYPEATVNKFFAPILRRSAELAHPGEEQRRFYAYINANDTLINEGIVASEELVSRFGRFDTLALAQQGQRRYIVVPIGDDASGPTFAGLRKLGLGAFKGLGKIPVYEVIDAGSWDRSSFKPIAGQTLMSALNRLFAASVSAGKRSSPRPTS